VKKEDGDVFMDGLQGKNGGGESPETNNAHQGEEAQGGGEQRDGNRMNV